MKLYDTEIEKYIFHQSKRAISINKIDINKIVVSDRASSCKNGLKSSLVIKILERLDFYVYFIQKPVHIEEILIKLNYFLIKGNELLQEHNEI